MYLCNLRVYGGNKESINQSTLVHRGFHAPHQSTLVHRGFHAPRTSSIIHQMME